MVIEHTVEQEYSSHLVFWQIILYYIIYFVLYIINYILYNICYMYITWISSLFNNIIF